MLDHLLGRPSLQLRKFQVLSVLLFWTVYLIRGNAHGPPLFFLRKLSRIFSKRLTAFQTVSITLLYLYVARNFAKLFNLESPEPLANLYTRSYFRATWVMTALDAGFWTAMRIKNRKLRDVCSVVFSIYYLFAAERADEKVCCVFDAKIHKNRADDVRFAEYEQRLRWTICEYRGTNQQLPIFAY
jgi:hypothetical protein